MTIAWTRAALLALTDGERAAIDVCRCGAPRSAHGGLNGHGAAIDPTLGCALFTWARFARADDGPPALTAILNAPFK